MLREHAVERAAELLEDVVVDRAPFPAREIVAGDAIAQTKTRHVLADRDHFTGAIA
jgi:hypothetical protein